jgi:hypothetical protein
MEYFAVPLTVQYHGRLYTDARPSNFSKSQFSIHRECRAGTIIVFRLSASEARVEWIVNHKLRMARAIVKVNNYSIPYSSRRKKKRDAGRTTQPRRDKAVSRWGPRGVVPQPPIEYQGSTFIFL